MNGPPPSDKSDAVPRRTNLWPQQEMSDSFFTSTTVFAKLQTDPWVQSFITRELSKLVILMPQ